jgi:hypothetical protein
VGVAFSLENICRSALTYLSRLFTNPDETDTTSSDYISSLQSEIETSDFDNSKDKLLKDFTPGYARTLWTRDFTDIVQNDHYVAQRKDNFFCLTEYFNTARSKKRIWVCTPLGYREDTPNGSEFSLPMQKEAAIIWPIDDVEGIKFNSQEVSDISETTNIAEVNGAFHNNIQRYLLVGQIHCNSPSFWIYDKTSHSRRKIAEFSSPLTFIPSDEDYFFDEVIKDDLVKSMLNPSPQSNGLENSLYESNIPDHCVEPLVNAIDQEIRGLELITTSTLSGVRGGAVGRINLSGDSYVFKVQTDEEMANKDAKVPALIHERAKGDLLFAQLAKRIPTPILSKPVQHGGYWVTLAEDVEEKVVIYDQIDQSIVRPELNKGLNPELIEALYVSALFHEAMIDVNDQEINNSSISTFSTPDKMECRLGIKMLYATDLFEGILKPAYISWAKELQEYEASSRTMTLNDNRQENYVGANGVGKYFVDFGNAKRGSEVIDVVKPLLLSAEMLKDPALLGEYVQSYIQMRQAIQFTFRGENVSYHPDARDLTNLSYKAGVLEGMKLAGWHHHTGKSGVNQLISVSRQLAKHA